MDVHQHTHTPRKKWTHYFWEFLMLFLAVFCGFLAEYKLEHTIEKNKEKQFIRSFIEDLKLDTAELSNQILLKTQSERGVDSLVYMLGSVDRKVYLNSIYRRGLAVGRGRPFLYHDRTIQQLKNSGAMRLIRRQAVSDSIMDYDLGVRNMQFFELKREETSNKYKEIAGYVFSAFVFHSMIDSINENHLLRPEGNPELLTDDFVTINRLCMFATAFRQSNHQVLTLQIQIQRRAIRLMDVLRKEYNLK